MDALREEMLSRWNTDGWNYDSISAHGTDDEHEQEYWGSLFSPFPKNAKLLDVGTGTGFIALTAARYGFSVTAVDWSDTMLTQAREKAAQEQLPIHFVNGRLEQLPFENECFNLVTARHLVWTLVEPTVVFREWFRVLEKGGAVLADYSPRKGTTHHGQHYSEETEKKLPLNRDVTPEEIKRLFAEAGFSDVSVITNKKEIHHGDHAHIKDVYMFTCVK